MPDRLEQLLGVVALAATDRIRASIEDELGAGGAAPAALVHLRAWPGTSLNELAAVLELSQPATVRLVDRLSERHLVTRAPGSDGRTLALQCTADGARVAETMLARRAESLHPLVADLAPEERAQLERLLERLTGALAADRPSALTRCRLCDREACQGAAHACPLNHTTR